MLVFRKILACYKINKSVFFFKKTCKPIQKNDATFKKCKEFYPLF